MVGMGRSVLVVEDDKLTLGLLTETLTQSGFVVGAASTATDAWRMWEKMDPDAVVLDVDLGPGVNGIDLADAFRAQEPNLAVLFLSNLPDARFAGRDPKTLPKNVGYVRKGQLANSKALVVALDAVLRGSGRNVPRHDLDPERPLVGLSRTQIEVLRMVALGMTNAQIAAERGTSAKAVYNVISRVMSLISNENIDEGNARVVAAREFIRAAGLPTS
jgi:DNA-binding NarL/FixJ family response regulator